jgi:hypothetical protein
MDAGTRDYQETLIGIEMRPAEKAATTIRKTRRH